jgi:DNA-binding transcriptional LysR family regulator
VRERLDLNAIDMNLLPKFRALYRHRNVSEAARELHITQSALSNALARMRVMFGDDLFVRTFAGMEPTQLAHAIAQPIECALAKLEGDFNRVHGFEPKRSSRIFKIAMTQLGEAWLAPHVLALARSVAPDIVVSTVTAGDRSEIALSHGGIDFLVGHLAELGSGFRGVELGIHEMLWMVRNGHPVFDGPLTLAALLAYSFAEVVESGTVYGALSRAIGRIGRPDALRYRTTNVMALPLVIAKTDLVALVPAWFGARCASSLGLQLIRVGAQPPVTTIRFFWHEKAEGDPGHFWMRSIIAKAASAAQLDEALQSASLTTLLTIDAEPIPHTGV